MRGSSIKIHFIKYLSFVLLFFSLAAFGQETIVLTNNYEIKPIGQSIAIFEDKTTTKTFEEISKPEFDTAFRKSTNDIPNFNLTKSVFWIKIKVTNQSDFNNWYLENTNASADHFNIYLPKPDGTFKETKSGFHVLLRNRDIKVRHPLFPLDIPKDSTITFYVKLSADVPLQAYLSIGKLDELMENYHVNDILHGGFFGLLFMLIIYNLFIYFSVKDKVYLFYMAYVISNGFFISFTLGYSIHLPDWAQFIFHKHPAWVPLCLGCTSCLFAIVFLDMKNNYKTGYRITIGMLVLFISVLICDFAGLKREAIMLVQLFGLVFSVISFLIGIKVLRKGYRPARFYLIGWTFYLAGLFTYISADLQLIPFNNFTHNAVEIGTAIEAVLLSMAIGDKISNYKKDKEIAQEEALEAAQQNEKLVREQNVVLEQKVKERTMELQEQKEIVEEKNKEIVDSINYAKRIQYTLLAHEEFLKQNLPEHFVLFKPKDIVSGDFYWAAEAERSSLQGQPDYKLSTIDHKLFYLAVCDSTGHGVPGAFMSLLNIGFLSEAIKEKNIYEPNKILDHVRERLIESISKEGQQDGFDGILLRIEKQGDNYKMDYASANNAPVLISDGKIIELGADKMPVGKGEKTEPFKLFSIDAKKGDVLFLYTDGYADQFGGPKGKKFKSKQLDNLLLENSKEELPELKTKLENRFEDWKGGLEQVDDVCVIGIKI
jgi:serine phosphatase RsbU (regulator of sigma subunit)